jgi:3-phosphoglycerate kinase
MARKKSVGDLDEAELKGKGVFVHADLNAPLDVVIVKLFSSIRLVIHPVQLKVFCDSPSSCFSSNLLL